MRARTAWLSLLLSVTVAESLWAQQQATTVQLPTFSYFTLNTTVSVPDRGGAYLGGVKRAASGRNEFRMPLLPMRPFRNSAFGQERSASGMHVTATIHDFKAMDKWLLSQPTTVSRSGNAPAGGAVASREGLPRRAPDEAKRRIARASASTAGRPAMSVAEARAQRLKQQQVRGREALTFFERGQKAEASGKVGAAKVYYKMAARRATGDLKTRIAARLDSLDPAGSVPKLARVDR